MPISGTPGARPGRRTIAVAPIIGLLLAGCSPASAPAPGDPPTLAAADPSPPPNPLVPTGAASTTTAAVAVTEGRRDAAGQPICTITVEGRTIDTLGSGEWEAYRCGPLVEWGLLEPRAGRRRIGLIYDSGSPNADFRTALILVEGAGGWAADPASAGTYDDRPEARSIAALRAAGA